MTCGLRERDHPTREREEILDVPLAPPIDEKWNRRRGDDDDDGAEKERQPAFPRQLSAPIRPIESVALLRS